LVEIPANIGDSEDTAEFKSGETFTILLVDDEDFVREMTTELLKSLGYRVEACEGGRRALELYKRSPKHYDLVVLDMVMDDMNGLETYFEMRKIDPGVKVLLSSGYSLDDDAQTVLKEGAGGFIQKPFSRATLSKQVAELLNK
jgi:CheY-like chemotaxis protein